MGAFPGVSASNGKHYPVKFGEVEAGEWVMEVLSCIWWTRSQSCIDICLLASPESRIRQGIKPLLSDCESDSMSQSMDCVAFVRRLCHLQLRTEAQSMELSNEREACVSPYSQLISIELVGGVSSIGLNGTPPTSLARNVCISASPLV